MRRLSKELAQFLQYNNNELKSNDLYGVFMSVYETSIAPVVVKELIDILVEMPGLKLADLNDARLKAFTDMFLEIVRQFDFQKQPFYTFIDQFMGGHDLGQSYTFLAETLKKDPNIKKYCIIGVDPITHNYYIMRNNQ